MNYTGKTNPLLIRLRHHADLAVKRGEPVVVEVRGAVRLRHTVTPNGDFYFINSRRVSKEKYDDAKLGRTLDSFLTTIKHGVIRHYCSVR